MFTLTEREFLPIHWLHQMEFCEFSLYLAHVERVYAPPTRQMVRGARQHAKLERAFNARAEPLEEPLEDHLEKMLAGEVPAFALRELDVESETHRLRGRIDEIRFYQEYALVIDSKPKSYVFPSDINQVRAYCLAAEEQFAWQKRLVGAIQNSHSGQFVYAEEFSAESRVAIQATIQRLHRLFRGAEEFKPTDNPAKCRACRFNRGCPNSLAVAWEHP